MAGDVQFRNVGGKVIPITDGDSFNTPGQGGGFIHQENPEAPAAGKARGKGLKPPGTAGEDGLSREDKTAGLKAQAATLELSRRRDSAEEGVEGAGTFRSLYGHHGDPQRFKVQTVKFDNLLTIPQEMVDNADPGYPALSLYQHWGGKDWKKVPVVHAERLVAGEAHRRGFDGIRYGDYEVQDLRSLKGKENG